MSERVLLIEDDTSIADLVKMHLEESGYKVDSINNGKEGLEAYTKEAYSLIIIDLMLPGLDGKEIIKKIRASNNKIPILITTAKSDLMHKVVGFELGADDYLAKPYEIAELIARSKALLRRMSVNNSADESDELIEIGNIKVDQYRHKVFIKGKEIELSPKLFDLLLFLIKRPGRAFSRGELLTHVWNYEHEGYEHTVDTHINRLRSKIEPKPATPTYILTVWGVGYRFVEIEELKNKK